MELDEALEQARAESDLGQFEVIVLDVCLMGTVEVANAMAPHANYLVASEEVVPGFGQAYGSFFDELLRNPGMDGYYTVDKVTETGSVELIEWTYSALIDQDEGAENVLAVQGAGDTYTLFINGLQVDQFTDAGLSGGAFGPIADNYDPAAPANFFFDDLIVGRAAR